VGRVDRVGHDEVCGARPASRWRRSWRCLWAYPSRWPSGTRAGQP